MQLLQQMDGLKKKSHIFQKAILNLRLVIISSLNSILALGKVQEKYIFFTFLIKILTFILYQFQDRNY